MRSSSLVLLIVLLAATTAHAKPFFDAIYDAINGNARRSYGYSGYGNYGYERGYGYGGSGGRRERQGKTYKEICRVHFPDAVASPGAGGVVCPY